MPSITVSLPTEIIVRLDREGNRSEIVRKALELYFIIKDRLDIMDEKLNRIIKMLEEVNK